MIQNGAAGGDIIQLTTAIMVRCRELITGFHRSICIFVVDVFKLKTVKFMSCFYASTDQDFTFEVYWEVVRKTCNSVALKKEKRT